MNEFLVGALIGVGGSIAISMIATKLSNQNPGGPWASACTAAGGVSQTATTPYTCMKGGQSIYPTVQYPFYENSLFQMGAPILAAFIATQSTTGALGAGVGVAGLALIGIAGIT